MTNHSVIRFSTMLAVVVLAGSSYVAAQPDRESSVLLPFRQAVSDYSVLHHAVELGLPALDVSVDAEAIHAAIDARAAAIRRARADASIGDIFAPEVAHVLRMRIRSALEAAGLGCAELLERMYDGAEWEVPVVNGTFEWSTAIATPPAVLAVLPPLPEELQYRFVGADLVLVDIEANLIVDVLTGVLDSGAPTRDWPHLA
jgi:hypothetical protein